MDAVGYPAVAPARTQEATSSISALTGIPDQEQGQWRWLMTGAFNAYHRALEIWSAIFERDPSVAGIPASLLEAAAAGDEKAQKTVDRLKRNYAFDRARCFIPVAATTNMMLRMSARGWAELIQKLLSLSHPEANALGELLKTELHLAAPRLDKHTVAKDYWRDGLAYEFQLDVASANAVRNPRTLDPHCRHSEIAAEPNVHLEVQLPSTSLSSAWWEGRFVDDLQHHPNRYAYVGPHLRRTQVRVRVDAVDFACIRDKRRHRTGYHYVPMVPQGFYWAEDQIPEAGWDFAAELIDLARQGQHITAYAYELLKAGDPSYVYFTLLGTQYPWEHGTTADKVIYEWESRLGGRVACPPAPGPHLRGPVTSRGTPGSP